MTKVTCKGDGDDVLSNYMYRDAAVDAIKDFCNSQDGKIVKQGDEATFIKETTFSIRYAEPCAGSGSYTVQKDLCEKYLIKSLDECDTATIVYKHGGELLDQDNCGLFEFHPTGYDVLACHPEDVERGYVREIVILTDGKS